uniref:Uncharacterized protein n=2 Tax=Aegilops tauschii subsp. strangulata TaxID=200361 RepID=A0A452YAJ8_AEGTS
KIGLGVDKPGKMCCYFYNIKDDEILVLLVEHPVTGQSVSCCNALRKVQVSYFSSIGKGPPSPRLSPSPEGRRAAVGPQPTLPVVPYHCSIFSPNPLPPDLLLMYPNYHWSFGEHSSVQVEHWAPSE